MKPHYPYITRSLIRLFEEGKLTNIKDIIVEPEYGYVSRINYIDGTFRIIYGADLGLNIAASADLAKDKGFTKFMLRKIGINCPDGKEFLLPSWEKAISPIQNRKNNFEMQTSDKAQKYIHDYIGYPIFIKPINGSQGTDVFRVDDDGELAEFLEMYEKKNVRIAVIEKLINMPDYRIVILDGQLISAYKRTPLAVIGNGLDNIETLVNKLQEKHITDGRNTNLDLTDIRITKHLKKQNISLNYIPANNENVTLISVSNLSAGGTSTDVSDIISPHWVELSEIIAKNFNLRLCGVDLACEDISSANSEYSVYEVNAAPGLDHYASSGANQKRIVDELYTKVFNAPHIQAN